MKYISIVKRVRLSNRDVRELREVWKHMSPLLEEADVVEVIQLRERLSLYLIDGEPLIFKTEEEALGEVAVPTLYLIHKSNKASLLPQFPKAQVDGGAVKPIINGADVMRPGVRQITGEFKKGDVVFIVDEKNRVISIACALYDRGEIEQMQRGKVFVNLHHLGDDIWRLSLELVKEKS